MPREWRLVAAWSAACGSPVMLVSKKGTKDKRVVADFRYLNRRIRRYNHPFPLVRDAIQILGASDCEVLSVIDRKDAYHSLNPSVNARGTVGLRHTLVEGPTITRS